MAQLAAEVDSAEAARLLGYASTASFASAYAQGNLPELGEPVGCRKPPGAAARAGRGPRRACWRRQESCVKALEPAGGAPVSAKELFAADPEAGILQQWKATLDAMRRQLRAAP